jgi:hypothetical protein
VGGITWCITGCTNNIWASAAGSTIVSSDVAVGNTSLVLTQTGASPFNFDSSERGGFAPGLCNSTNPCATTLNINGTAIPLSGGQVNALAAFNQDPGGTVFNEASNWNGAVFNGGPGNLIVWFGYVDTAHSGTCADTTGTVAGNCQPDNPWQGSARSNFVGAPTVESVSTSCTRTENPTSCFDAGAIRIEVNAAATTPDPSTMMLMGLGLVGLAAWKRRFGRK